MRIGATELIQKYGSPLHVAEALLAGKLNSHEQGYVDDVVSESILEAAKFRMREREHAVLSAARVVTARWKNHDFYENLVSGSLQEALDQLSAAVEGHGI